VARPLSPGRGMALAVRGGRARHRRGALPNAARRARALARTGRVERRGDGARPRARRRSHRGGLGDARSHGAEGDQVVAIVVDRETKLVVQGLTGREGSFHGLRNRGYGTQVVAGVQPGKGGQDVEGVPIFDTVAGAVSEAGANTTMVFVPARFAADAIYE